MLMPLTTRLLVVLSFIIPCSAFAAGVPPWKFGMTKAEVASFKEFGPYKTFSNGDLETFNGPFHGRKENIQFFFEGDRLRRIGVYMGEGTDRNKAVAAFEQAYRILEQDYGKIELPEMKVSGGGTPPPTVIAVGALANADVTGKTQMAPVNQPKDMFVFCSAYRYFVRGQKWFAIAIMFDKHRWISPNASNKALQRTATRFALTFCLSTTLSLRATHIPGGRRSALSR